MVPMEGVLAPDRLDRAMDLVGAAVAFVVGLSGVLLGALLSRRNERRAHADRLLTDALNDAVGAIARVASGAGIEAQSAYASAVSRVALHGSPEVVRALRLFQDDATTITEDGRDRLVAALTVARSELGHRPAGVDDLGTLLFGSQPISVEVWRKAEAATRESVDALQASVDGEATKPTHDDSAMEELKALAVKSPGGAIVGAFQRVEQQLRRIGAEAGAKEADSGSIRDLTRALVEAEAITPESLSAIQGLVVLRNLAAHGRDGGVSVQRAVEYVVLADGVLYALSRSPGLRAPSPTY